MITDDDPYVRHKCRLGTPNAFCFPIIHRTFESQRGVQATFEETQCRRCGEFARRGMWDGNFESMGAVIPTIAPPTFLAKLRSDIVSMFGVSLHPTFKRERHQKKELDKQIKLLYFEWSPPWHVGWGLSGECYLPCETGIAKLISPATLAATVASGVP